jgi:hypothetical protein
MRFILLLELFICLHGLVYSGVNGPLLLSHHARVLIFVLRLNVCEPDFILILIRVNLFKLFLSSLALLKHHPAFLGLLGLLASKEERLISLFIGTFCSYAKSVLWAFFHSSLFGAAA